MPKSPSALPMIACGLFMVFAGLGWWMFAPGLDLQLFDALRLTEANMSVALATIVTRAGGLAVMGPVALAVVFWLLFVRRPGEAIWLFVTIATGRLAVDGLKLLFARVRPPLSDRLDLVTSLSFPSSHSAGTMLTLLALAMLPRGRQNVLVPLAAALALLIGWTRVALGVHWPSDVLAGLGFGMLWTGVAARWLPDRGPARSGGRARRG